jgi:hypothetical protein
MSNPFPAVCSGYRAAVTSILRRSEPGVTPASTYFYAVQVLLGHASIATTERVPGG